MAVEFSSAYSKAFAVATGPTPGDLDQIFLIDTIDDLYIQRHISPLCHLVDAQPRHWGETKKPLNRLKFGD